ncbi:hypothetical protein AJ80_07906 [Polytolypa hystricis UAMH7299]|uniref:Zinc finger PHD-type domain-containing protein n=1 Tax=Polytolypa hystricis (strain UAMH7299) TaxID=1447883 RepID=A0A2B7XHC6_POLH7|nr:hypothetical protein AJ80_07906 [Polytolypa hystricis UAMH7299]
MVSRKRAREEAEDSRYIARAPTTTTATHTPEHEGLLHRLRDMWEFANLVQYIYSFGKVVKVDDTIDIDDLETECLKPTPSEKLLEIGLTLLKFVSSHRGLTTENFEEYTRRQYLAKAPSRNPFGDDEQPTKFNDLDIFQRIRILQQLSAWTFWNPDRMRERLPEQKEIDQTQWRIEEIGYDRNDCVYYLLDDNRLYRRTDPAIPPPVTAKPKANSKKARAAARAAKRRKLAEAAAEKDEDDEDQKNSVSGGAAEPDSSDGYKWECIAITLSDYQQLIEKLRKTKDPNEQILRDQLIENVLPVLEKVEEAQQRKIQRREKELINLQKLANAKRSSRIAGKQERERQEIEAAEEERKREAERIAELKEEEKKKKIEQERQYRLMTREQRLKDREEKRRLHGEELARIAEEAKKVESGEARMSERHLKAEMEKRKKHLESLQQEDQWVFDCSGCGVHGENLDDGSHSVACDKCNVWQHSKCLGIVQSEAEKDDFHFVCVDCKRREEEAKRPKIPPLKFRIGASASPSEKSKVNGEERKHDEPTSPSVKKVKRPSSSAGQAPSPPIGTAPVAQVPANGHILAPAWTPSAAPTIPIPAAIRPNGISSPQRQPQRPINGSAYRLPQSPPQLYNPPRNPPSLGPSPIKQPVNVSPGQLPQQSPTHMPTFVHYHPPAPIPSSAATSFNSQRPSSSHSTHNAFPSPIQNRPSMSPSQGNRDVGPLAGFPQPPPNVPNGSVPATPYAQGRPPTSNASPYGITPSANHSTHPPSFSSNSASASNSFAHTPPPPHYSQNMPLSGRSPTKQSPAQPRPSSSFGSGIATAPILPPIQRLQPSPKLMGRSSPDAPIPPPVKGMTPEQEDRRRRENELLARNAPRPLGSVAQPSLASSQQSAPALTTTTESQGAQGPAQQ